MSSKGMAVQRPRLVVLYGPAGCGKTVALTVAAAELGLDVVEWINPVDVNKVQSVASTAQPIGRQP